MCALNTSGRFTILAAVVGLAVHVPAGHDAQGTSFKSGVDMVPLTVTVTDPSGQYIAGLSDRDFTILEDGIRQPVSFFARDEVPFDLALVVDTSTSMSVDLPLVQKAAGGLVRTLRPTDRGAIVQVSDKTLIPQPLTGDHATMDTAIRKLRTFGSTALYDGLYVVLREFARERRNAADARRQVLVLLSDGVDTTSRLSFDDVMELARRGGVNIYVIALRGDVPKMRRADLDVSVLHAEYAMGAVARESGGRTFFPKTIGDLPAICSAIARELASQYELGYMPLRADNDGSFRRVTVQLQPGINALARTRSGYFASRTPGRQE